jgi:uncharacterized membrane-anchored protein
MNATSENGSTGLMNKVPPISLCFWVIKMMATTVGESTAGFLNARLRLGSTDTFLLMGDLLIVALTAQLLSRRYVPWGYWLVVVLISVVASLFTDNITEHLSVPLEVSTVVFGVALAATFAVWRAMEKTLSVRSILTVRQEAFYWTAVFLTFALGTVAADYLSEILGVGYGHATLLCGIAIALVALAHRFWKLNAIVAFWIVYILTRPFGASVGDLLSQSVSHGGLGLGARYTNAIFSAVIVLLIAYLTAAGRRAHVVDPDSRTTPE